MDFLGFPNFRSRLWWFSSSWRAS